MTRIQTQCPTCWMSSLTLTFVLAVLWLLLKGKVSQCTASTSHAVICCPPFPPGPGSIQQTRVRSLVYSKWSRAISGSATQTSDQWVKRCWKLLRPILAVLSCIYQNVAEWGFWFSWFLQFTFHGLFIYLTVFVYSSVESVVFSTT